MRKALLVLVLLVAMTGFATAADLGGFHSSPTDRMVGYLGLIGESQSIAIKDAGAETSFVTGQTGIAVGSLQVLGDGGEGMFNFFAQESFSYMFGGTYTIDKTPVVIEDCAGYFAGLLVGASTNLPTFVDGLEIMVGAGYHMDFGYLMMLTNPEIQSAMLIDMSLLGLGLSVAADWALMGDLGLSLVIDWTLDLWGFSLPIGGAVATAEGELVSYPSMNFGVAVGVSIPNELAAEFDSSSY